MQGTAARFGVKVRDEAMLGHFTIHLDDPLQWGEVGSIISARSSPTRPTAITSERLSGVSAAISVRG